MLTRLKVNGFKNLVDVDLSFGTFTCIAGANGVGKSNVFDAIRFLSALANEPLIDAARKIRDDKGSSWDVRALFHRVGNTFATEISFEVEMIIPSKGQNEITQSSLEATSTLLSYKLTIARDEKSSTSNPLRIVSESLEPIRRGQTDEVLRFPHSKSWVHSIVTGRRTVKYISTQPGDGDAMMVHLHQDKQAGRGSGGRSFQYAAGQLTRTVLSLANSNETPTVLLAKRELQSWRQLQLEPSALRQPDSFLAPTRLSSNGEHLPATLYRLAREEFSGRDETAWQSTPAVYSRISNRLYALLEEIRSVSVDRDEKRDLLTLQVIDKNGTILPAKSLSDGTLRFLALSVLAEDPLDVGVICFEEPENGIHPQRIPAIIKLLQDIACDPYEVVDDTNPLRQVIVNTHSPGVVGGVDKEELILARSIHAYANAAPAPRLEFAYIQDSWQIRKPSLIPLVTKSEVLHYLMPVTQFESEGENHDSGNGSAKKSTRRRQRVFDLFRQRPGLFDSALESQ